LITGLVLFAYLTVHLSDHALGLISLNAAENALRLAVIFWHSWLGTSLLYGAAAVHFLLALSSVYQRRTFRLPPLELIRIALGFTLPTLLIGHAASTRLAYDLFSSSAGYTRVVTNLWNTDAQGLQLGLLAPGWIHGCLGLHFVFNLRPLYRRLRLVLFGAALLLPVLSAAGFLAMARELAANGVAAEAALDFTNAARAAQRATLSHWRDGLLIGYFGCIGVTFLARAVRNVIERTGKHLITISYPHRTVCVPRGWTVLEASRSFHLAHASICGGRARCSTCRVQVTAGQNFCPPAELDEQHTLDRIGASPGVRLACQLRPTGTISIIPLVQTEGPVYRTRAEPNRGEREIVALFVDLSGGDERGREHIPQDQIYTLTLHLEALGNAIRRCNGALSSIQSDSICALFGLECGPEKAAQQALTATRLIENVLSDLKERVGEGWNYKLKATVTITIGRAALGEVNSLDLPSIIAIGEAIDIGNDLRRRPPQNGQAFVILEQVFKSAGHNPAVPGEMKLRAPDLRPSISAYVFATAPGLLPRAVGVPKIHVWRAPAVHEGN
jgi:adenylate cyclase